MSKFCADEADRCESWKIMLIFVIVFVPSLRLISFMVISTSLIFYLHHYFPKNISVDLSNGSDFCQMDIRCNKPLLRRECASIQWFDKTTE